jgi:hypothetical protein
MISQGGGGPEPTKRLRESGEVVFKLSGRIETENIAELEALLTSGRSISSDLSDITLVDQDVVDFLSHFETDGIKLENCPAYVPRPGGGTR